MTDRDDILRMAREAGMAGMLTDVVTTFDELERFAALVAAAERNRMISEGWRQCAQGQRTSQWCAVAEQARQEEREACLDCIRPNATPMEMAAAIRARSKT